MATIIAPLPFFTDRSGDALDSGYVYIGTANQNPQTNPITVYWDAALTITAQQPLRTSGGYIYRNGTPANLYVASPFSMTVRDREGELVYTFPSAPALDPSGDFANTTNVALGDALVGFKQSNGSGALTGAVGSTVHTKLQEIISFEDFGAVGDGVTDDAAAIQAAIAAVGNGTTINGKPGKTYLIGSAGLLIDTKTGLNLVGNGSKIKAGALSARMSLISSRCVVKLLSCVECSISGFVLDGGGFANDMVSLNTCTDCTVEDNVATNAGAVGLLNSFGGVRSAFLDNIIKSWLTPATGIRIGHYNTDAQVDFDVLVQGNRVDAGGIVGDGILLGSCVGGDVIGNVCNRGFTGIVFSGANGRATKRVSIIGNKCEGNSGQGIQSDIVYATDADVSTDMVIGGNVCYNNGASGIYLVRSFNASIVNNICLDNADIGIIVQGGRGWTVTGNICRDTRVGGARTQETGIHVIADSGLTGQPATDDAVVVGNYCQNHLSFGIAVQGVGTGTIDSCVLSANVCNDNSSRGIIVTEATAGAITFLSITDNICKGNTTHDIRVDTVDAVIKGNRFSTQQSLVLTFTSLDTTPSVAGREQWRCNNGGATAITNFDDAMEGQEITILFADANTTIADSGNFRLNGAFTSAANTVLKLVFRVNLWYEISRSAN